MWEERKAFVRGFNDLDHPIGFGFYYINGRTVWFNPSNTGVNVSVCETKNTRGSDRASLQNLHAPVAV